MTGESAAQCPRSALGYTARRCGEAEPALVVEGYATFHRRGLAAISPVATGEGIAPVSDRLAQSSPCSVRPDACALRMPYSFASRLHQSGSSATGRTDSPLPKVERDRLAERRKSGGTQEHAASALCQRWCGRIVRDSIGLAADAHLAENGSPWVRGSINRRGFQVKAGVAELVGGIFRGAAARDGKGWTLVMSDRFSGKVCPSPSGFKPAVARGSWADINR